VVDDVRLGVDHHLQGGPVALKVGISTSMLMPGHASRVRMIVSAQMPAPPSGVRRG
jgi:hypothetical protein